MDNIEQNKKNFLLEMLKQVPFSGWNEISIKHAAEALNWSTPYVSLLFPNNIYDILNYFIIHIDKNMLKDLEVTNLHSMKISSRIYTIIQARLNQNLIHRPAIAKMIYFCTLPQNTLYSLKTLWRTVDNIWFVCKDQSTDFNYYTKRLILSGVYSSTLLHWVNDFSENQIETMEFLERRINDALKIGTFKHSLKNKIQNIPFLRLLN
ncbi:hypothetical protein NOVO_02945 [Rickettsiales bacterium Ac37b]|nr:hypothetical protein NOVO_02945 [Rickettsiales bacterium Ac37b]